MNWEDIGAMVGYNLAGGYFKNQHDRWMDEGRKALKDMANVNDADRTNARGFLQGAIDRNGLIGQDPQLLYLKQKQGYMQAANDKQYLLDNGYAEDSKEVKDFDAKMAAAHKNADELRAYAKSAGFDFGGLGDGMNLQQLNHEVSRRQFPALYDESRYDLSNHLPHDKRLWSDMGADYALGKTNTMPTFGAGGAQPTQEQAAAMEAVAAQAAPQAGAPQTGVPQAQAGAPQTLGVPGLAKPASELSIEELTQLLGGRPSFRDDPFGLRGANPGNAFSLGASNALANQGGQGTAAQNTATPSQTAQMSAGETQAPDASVDMGQSADAHTDAPVANGGYPYQGILMGANGGIKNTTSVPNQITAESIYKYLQSIGQIDKKVDYNAAIDELAKAFAAERVKRMTDDDKREYLVSHGIGNDIASIVIPEANAKARDKARQEAIAKMAASATNPMMAEALSLMALTDGTKPGDFMDAIGKTKPEMGFNDLDLGGTKMQTMYDKNGWLKPEAAQFVKTLSPNEIVVSRDKAAGRQLRANIADAEIKKDLAVAKANNNTRYATAKMQQEGANWRAQYEQKNANWRELYRGQYRSQNGGSGGSGGRAAGGKVSEAEKKLSNQFANQFNTVMELYNKTGEVAHDDMADAVDEFTQSVLDGIRSGEIGGDDATYLLNKAYLAQLVYAAKFGEKGAAREIWSNFSDDYLYDTDNPDYAILNNIYQWLDSDSPDAAEKAHEQNTLSDPEKEYRPQYDEAILNMGDPTLR